MNALSPAMMQHAFFLGMRVEYIAILTEGAKTLQLKPNR